MSNSDPTDTAITTAFEELRREVSLTRAAVEGLTAARERIPDYTETLVQIAERLKATAAATARIEKAPAVSLTPDAMAAKIIEASITVRVADARLIHEARDALSRSIGQVDGMVKRGQAADQQFEQKTCFAIGGLIAGMLIWSTVPGVLARSMPTSWHVPLWMAERTLHGW